MLRRGAVEVDLDRVSRDRHGGPDLEQALRRLERVGALEAAVRELGERGAHDALRVREELVHRRRDPLPAAARAELLDPALGEVVRRELRAEVAAALVRVPHLRDEPLERVASSRRVGGMTTPSSASVVEPAGRLPGSEPPTSA